MTARECALHVLTECALRGAYADAALLQKLTAAKLDARDAALCTRLVYGVLQHRIYLDAVIAQVSTVKPRRMEQKVLDALRIGVYQMLFLDKIPSSAAISESVTLVRRFSKNPRASGMVNGILRTIDRQGAPEILDAAIKYSHPQWLADCYERLLGKDEAVQLMRADNEIPAVTVQVNSLRANSHQLLAQLAQEGAEAERHPFLDGCLQLRAWAGLSESAAYREGLFYVQDAAARLSVKAAAPQAGMQVLDACAAPGGKSFAAAIDMKHSGNVISCDVSEQKVSRIASGAMRLGLSIIEPILQDASVFRPDWENRFDLVIADVPCSGLGIIRKKPDIRYKDPDEFAALEAIQRAILENVSRYVKQGGVLLYSTCTIRPEENEEIVSAFLAAHSAFSLEAFSLPQPVGAAQQGMLTLYPHQHGTDGFFIAKLRKQYA